MWWRNTGSVGWAVEAWCWVPSHTATCRSATTSNYPPTRMTLGFPARQWANGTMPGFPGKADTQQTEVRSREYRRGKTTPAPRSHCVRTAAAAGLRRIGTEERAAGWCKHVIGRQPGRSAAGNSAPVRRRRRRRSWKRRSSCGRDRRGAKLRARLPSHGTAPGRSCAEAGWDGRDTAAAK